MKNGVTLIAPETVFFSHDTKIGKDVVIGPNVVFGPNVKVANKVTINAFNNFLISPLITIVLVSSLWALWYHFCTGLRHLYWDMGYGYNLKSVSISGWVAVVCSFLLTFLTLLFFIN